jgi:hypothetical protein
VEGKNCELPNSEADVIGREIRQLKDSARIRDCSSIFLHVSM